MEASVLKEIKEIIESQDVQAEASSFHWQET